MPKVCLYIHKHIAKDAFQVMGSLSWGYNQRGLIMPERILAAVVWFYFYFEMDYHWYLVVDGH